MHDACYYPQSNGASFGHACGCSVCDLRLIDISIVRRTDLIVQLVERPIVRRTGLIMQLVERNSILRRTCTSTREERVYPEGRFLYVNTLTVF